MLIGVTVFAYITGTVSSLLSSFNTQAKRVAEHQHQLDSFCRSHQIPKPLGEKLGQFYDYVLARKVHPEDVRIISGLSGALRTQVCPRLQRALLSLTKRNIESSRHSRVLLQVNFQCPPEF